MALNTNALLKRYSARALTALRTALIFPSLCNRDYQQEFQNAYTVEIPSTITDRDAESVNRNAEWIAATDAALTLVPRSLTKQSMMASAIPFLDQRQAPVNLIDREGNIHNRGYASRIDKDVAAVMVAGIPAGQVTTISATDNPHVNVDGSWDADTSADNTVAKQDAIMLALHNWLEGWIVSAINAGYGPDQLNPLGMWVVMNPAIWRVYRAWLQKQDFLSEDIATQLFLNGRLVMGPNGMVARVLEGIIILRSPNMPRVAGDTSANTNGEWQVMAGTRRANSFASIPMLSQMFNPRQNQTTKPGWLLRGTNFYDAWTIESTTMRLFKIPGPESLTEHLSGLELTPEDELVLSAEDLAAQLGPQTIELPPGATININQPEPAPEPEPAGKGGKKK